MARPMKKDAKPSSKTKEERLAESGDPGDMKELGESISGSQPEIGHKDTGIGRRVREDRSLPPSAP